VIPLRNRWIVILVTLFSLACYHQASRYRWSGEIGLAMQLIGSLYYQERDPAALYQAAMDGMVGSLDAHSQFIPAEQYQTFRDFLQQQFGGVGIMIDGPPSIPELTVVSPLLDSPAYQAGLEPGDVIVAIDEAITSELTLEESIDRIKGPQGSLVRLKIRSVADGQLRTVELKRSLVQVESVVGEHRRADSSWEYFLPDTPSIAYLRLITFGDRTTNEFRSALQAVLPTAQGLILDLREDGGGLMNAAIEICDMFLDGEMIVSTRGRVASLYAEYPARPGRLVPPELPLVVLVNGQSASASEIVAACLQDHQRAVIVGQRTFGKGTVQNVIDLDGGRSALKLTTATYFRPSGRNIHRSPQDDLTQEWGVQPNPGLEVEVDQEQRRQIFQRWRLRGDPRLASAVDPTPQPLPEDPQLAVAIETIRAMLSPAPGPDASLEVVPIERQPSERDENREAAFGPIGRPNQPQRLAATEGER
jgi:carboxyl-terminal processing protease